MGKHREKLSVYRSMRRDAKRLLVGMGFGRLLR